MPNSSDDDGAASLGGVSFSDDGQASSLGGVCFSDDGQGDADLSDVASVGGVSVLSSVSVGGLSVYDSDDDIEQLPDVEVDGAQQTGLSKARELNFRGRSAQARTLRDHVEEVVGRHRGKQRLLRKVKLVEDMEAATRRAGHGVGAAWLLHYVISHKGTLGI